MKTERITIRLDIEERKLLTIVAKRLQRTPSDAVRFIIREVAAQFEQTEEGDGGND